jgi:VIT1/CCC1 family predicted Fe2+/Mn2+ transporter
LGSPWVAAASSFIAFATGAIIPVIPYLILTGNSAFIASAVVCAIALFVLGGLVSIFTGRNFLFSGSRMLGIGIIAAALTYFIGRILGVSVGS